MARRSPLKSALPESSKAKEGRAKSELALNGAEKDTRPFSKRMVSMVPSSGMR